MCTRKSQEPFLSVRNWRDHFGVTVIQLTWRRRDTQFSLYQRGSVVPEKAFTRSSFWSVVQTDCPAEHSFTIIFRFTAWRCASEVLWCRRVSVRPSVTSRHSAETETLCACIRVVHGSILCDPIQPNRSADWPDPTLFNWKNLDPTQYN